MNWGNLVVQPGLLKIPIHHFDELRKTGKCTQPNQHFKIQIIMPHAILKNYPHRLTKEWRQEDFKNPNFQIFQWIGKHLAVQPRLLKNPNYSNELRKTWKYTQPNQHFKVQILNLLMNWERIENKMGNVRKKGGHVLNLT